MRKTNFYRTRISGAGIAAILFFGVLLFQGCAPAHLSKNFGESYEAILLAQTVNPDGPEDRNPPDLPGVVAEGIYNDYLSGVGTQPGSDQSGQTVNVFIEN